MLWMDRVFSVAYQTMKITTSTTAKNGVDTSYGTPSLMCMPSAGDVPPGAELEHQCDRQADGAQGTSNHRTIPEEQEVGGRLALAGGQHLDDPEEDRDLRNLAQPMPRSGRRPTMPKLTRCHRNRMPYDPSAPGSLRRGSTAAPTRPASSDAPRYRAGHGRDGIS